MKFILKKSQDLNRVAFGQHPAWGQYYEPNDVERLVDLGYERETVVALLELAGWSDDYWFPIPNGIKPNIFRFEHRKAKFITPKGKILSGYYINNEYAIGIFGSKEDWIINLNLLELFEDELPYIREDLALEDDDSLIPLDIIITGENIEIKGWGSKGKASL